MKYLSIDIETSGLEPQRHDILSFAAVLEDTANPIPLDELPYFYCYVRPERDNGSVTGQPYALQMNWGILRILAGIDLPGDTPIYPATKFVNHFAEWLAEQAWPYRDERANLPRLNLAGKNVAGFDYPFLVEHEFDHHFVASKRVLDPAILYADWSSDSLPDLATCLRRAGIDDPVRHDAYHDALQVIQLLRPFYGKKLWE